MTEHCAGQVMLDPYAPIATKVLLPNGVNVPPPKKGLPQSSLQSNPPAMMGCLASLLESFDWGASKRPWTPPSQNLVLEVDVPSLPGQDGSEHQGDPLVIGPNSEEKEMPCRLRRYEQRNGTVLALQWTVENLPALPMMS